MAGRSKASVPSAHSRSQGDGQVHLKLNVLGRFRLVGLEGPIELPQGSARLLALITTQGRELSRDLAAGLLWPAVPEPKARACLRTALARLGAAAPGVLRPAPHVLMLAADVEVDVEEARAVVEQLMARDFADVDEALVYLPAFSADLLPGWYDDWAINAAETWRLLRLHALEATATALAKRGRLGHAAAVASAAVAADPLRDSARQALIWVHLTEGNAAEALREFERFRQLLRRTLGIEPSERLKDLVRAGTEHRAGMSEFGSRWRWITDGKDTSVIPGASERSMSGR
jgi:SARP family transcriptional regulator, regulator of embCAB operon